ncbi:hypothetical protein TNCV_3954301 [Trichonephila clavipes]|nr:hypothetical protein TNCV_3954301 [Trichonephila clavipes]
MKIHEIHRGEMLDFLRLSLALALSTMQKSAMKIFQILTETYGDETLSPACVFEWYKMFSEGRVSVEDDESAGCPKSAITDQKIAKVRDMSGFPLTSVVRLLINTSIVKC